MATDQDVFAAMQLIAARTGDPKAWQAGLTAQEVIDFLSPATPGQVRDALLDRIRRQHPDVFDPAGAPLPDRVPAPPRSPAPPDHADGDAAKAIAEAEAALAHQNSMTSQLDLQVVTAILNAHLTNAEGNDTLASLQREIETAVATRSDLDTPAGARDFQRFLIGKLRDIRAVVATAGLDDTSKSALMAAWTSLYNASKDEPRATGWPRRPRPRVAVAPAAEANSRRRPPPAPDQTRCWTRCCWTTRAWRERRCRNLPRCRRQVPAPAPLRPVRRRPAPERACPAGARPAACPCPDCREQGPDAMAVRSATGFSTRNPTGMSANRPTRARRKTTPTTMPTTRRITKTIPSTSLRPNSPKRRRLARRR